MPGLALAAAAALCGTSLVFSSSALAQMLTDQQLEDVKDNLWLGAQQTYVTLHATPTYAHKMT